MGKKMQIFSPTVLVKSQGQNNLKSTSLTKPAAAKEQAMDFMQLLLVMTCNQGVTQQDAAPIYWNNFDTGNADGQGGDKTLENNTSQSHSATLDINSEIMQLLQLITCNLDAIQQTSDSNSWNNFNIGNVDKQGGDVTLENSTSTNQSVISDISPETMQLLQAVLSPGGEQSLDIVNQDAINQALQQNPKLNLLLEMAAVTGEYQPFYSMDNLQGTLSQKSFTLADILSMGPGNNLNLDLKQITGANDPIAKNIASGLINETKIKMDLNGYFIARPETDSKIMLSRISNTASGIDLNGLVKTEPSAVTLPQQVNLTGLAKDTSTAAANNTVQLALKAQTEGMGASLPQQGAAGLAQAVDGKVENAKFSVAKADSTAFGVTAQQSNVAVASVNVAADSGAKHEGQQFTQQGSGSQTTVSGMETFSVKPSGEGVLQQLRVDDKSFVSRFAEIIKGHVNKDSSGQTHIKLQLQPESLGQVIIRLVFKDGNISTQFQAATEHAKQIIENSLPQLRETLANFQLNLQNASVTVGGEDGGNSKWGREWNQGGNNNSRRNQFKGDNDDLEVVDNPSKSKDVIKQNQLNYFI